MQINPYYNEIVLDFVGNGVYTEGGSLTCQIREVVDMTGHIYIKGNLCEEDGTYVVRARVPDPLTGKKKHKSKSTGLKVKDGTKRKAEKLMREIVAKWEEEANQKVHIGEPLMSEYVKRFLERKEKEARGNTVHSYKGYAETHILPALGAVPVREIKRQHIQSFYNSLLNRGLSPGSIRKIGVVVAGALHMAVLDDVIQANVAKSGDIELPKATKYRSKAYTEEQMATLIHAVQEDGEPIRCAVILASMYGLRRSEVCGLRWMDIDLEKGEMYIRNTVTQNGGSIFRDNGTKTEKSRRILTLSPATIPYLIQLREEQERRGLELDKVCRWPDGKEVQPNYITQKFRRLLKKHGMEHIRFHDLRGTAASLLAPHATPKQLQEFMGHSKISTTMEIYVKAHADDRKQVAARMESILGNALSCSEKCSE